MENEARLVGAAALQAEIEVMRTEQVETARQFADHVKTVHPGSYIQSACHPCMNLKQVLILQNVLIERKIRFLNTQVPAEVSEA
jgi:isocitrate lyase